MDICCFKALTAALLFIACLQAHYEKKRKAADIQSWAYRHRLVEPLSALGLIDKNYTKIHGRKARSADRP